MNLMTRITFVSVTDPEWRVRRSEYDDANHMMAWYGEMIPCSYGIPMTAKERVTEQEDAVKRNVSNSIPTSAA